MIDTAVSALVVSDVSKTFGATRALDEVTFKLDRGSVHALLGGNGSGKSTLIRILAGVQPADAGVAELGGDLLDLRTLRPSQARAAGMRFVHQQNATFGTLSVAENLAIGNGFECRRGRRISWAAQRRRAAQLLGQFRIEVHPDDSVADIGPANRKMIEIARALQDLGDANGGVLVLDEPTAALPMTEADRLLEAVRGYASDGLAIVYVTHRLDEVFTVADKVTLLRNGHNVGVLDPSDTTRDQLVEQMMGELVPPARHTRTNVLGEPVLTLEDFAGQRHAPMNLVVRSGEVVGVAGLIGSGRSSLLKTVFGVCPTVSGTALVAGDPIRPNSARQVLDAGVAYVPEDRAGDALFAGLSITENMSISVTRKFWKRGLMRHRDERRETRELITRFMIKAEDETLPITALSGGNQQKVVLARWLRRDPRVLLLDEPTQGVDVRARFEIYELIAVAVEGGAGVLVVSSDLEELVDLCDRVVVLRRGRLVATVTRDELTTERLNLLAHLEDPDDDGSGG